MQGGKIMVDTPILTDHAKERWAMRFQNMDLFEEYSRARKPSKKIMKLIRESCPSHQTEQREFMDAYYLSTRQGIVFIMRPPEVVVTVFDLRFKMGYK